MKDLNWDSKNIKILIKRARAIGLELQGINKKNKNGIYYEFIPKGCNHNYIALSSVIKKTYDKGNKYKCKVCWLDDLEKVAKKKGLHFLGRVDGARGVGKFNFIKCGHVKDIGYKEIKNTSPPRCEICINNEIKKEADEKNLEVISYVNQDNIHYKFKGCGCEQIISRRNVLLNKFHCSQCFKESLKLDAEKNGFILCSFGVVKKGTDIREYKCIECGNNSLKSSTNIKKTKAKCKACYKDKLRKEAKEAGIILIGYGHNSYYRLYKFEDCGHKRNIQITAVRNKTFSCAICNKNSITKPSLIYLLDITNNNMRWLKLGYAKDIDLRIAQYRLKSESNIKKIRLVKMATGKLAKIKEQGIHKKYKEYKYLDETMKEHMTFGWSECYPIEMKEILLEELANLGNK